MGMGCQIINFKENNNYEYISWGGLVGVDTVKGRYNRNFNTITLNPILPFEYNSQKSFVKGKTGVNNDTTLIQFYSLPAILSKINLNSYNIKNNKYYKGKLNKIDTVKEFAYFRINQNFYLSDSLGMIKAKLQKNDTIEVFQLLSTNSRFRYVVKEADIDTLNIYYATEGDNPCYYQKKFKLKNKGLFSFEDMFATEFLVKLSGNYKCFSYKERKAIRDSLFILISQNIDKKVFIDSYYDDFYIVFNKNGKVKKVLLNQFEDESIFNKFEDNASSFKIRRAIKKTINDYKIPFISKINYDYRTRLVVHYDCDTEKLELNYF